MCKFKKGDKVICINTDNHPELIKDKIYEVEKPNGDFVYLKGCKYGYFAFLFRKECEYCNLVSGDIRNLKTEKLFDLRIERHNNSYSLIASNIEDDIEIDINYCPICGRKLGGTKQ